MPTTDRAVDAGATHSADAMTTVDRHRLAVSQHANGAGQHQDQNFGLTIPPSSYLAENSAECPPSRGAMGSVGRTPTTARLERIDRPHCPIPAPALPSMTRRVGEARHNRHIHLHLHVWAPNLRRVCMSREFAMSLHGSAFDARSNLRGIVIAGPYCCCNGKSCVAREGIVLTRLGLERLRLGRVLSARPVGVEAGTSW